MHGHNIKWNFIKFDNFGHPVHFQAMFKHNSMKWSTFQWQWLLIWAPRLSCCGNWSCLAIWTLTASCWVSTWAGHHGSIDLACCFRNRMLCSTGFPFPSPLRKIGDDQYYTQAEASCIECQEKKKKKQNRFFAKRAFKPW